MSVRSRRTLRTLWLPGTLSLTLLACGNEDRAEATVGADANDPTDSSFTASDASSPGSRDEVASDTDQTDTDASIPTVDVQPDPGDTSDVSDAAEPDSFDEDVPAPIPPDPTRPDRCPELTITCSTRAGTVVPTGTSVMITNDPGSELDCIVSAEPADTAPAAMRWEETFPDVPRTFIIPVARWTASTSLYVGRVGPTELRFVAEYPDLLCTSDPFLLNVLPPDGLYLDVRWNDGLEAGDPNAGSTDVDIHLVRDGACLLDDPGSLYFGTRGDRHDWGIPQNRGDDPRLTYDEKSSPGFEIAWIEEPSAGQIAHYVLHGFRLDPRLDGSPVTANYRIFIDGQSAATGSVELIQEQYIAVGAFQDGRWVGSALTERPNGKLCPSLIEP